MTPAEGEGPSTKGGLSAHERELLAAIEARARHDDPDLEVRLRGRRRLTLPAWRPTDLPLWAAALAVLVGLAVTLVAVGTVVWLAVAGVALVGLGGYRLAVALAQRYQTSSHPGGSSGTTGA